MEIGGEGGGACVPFTRGMDWWTGGGGDCVLAVRKS